MGQHFMFEKSRWLQPIPVLARLAGELDPHVRLGTQILIAPLYNPVLLAEELATLDVVTGGRLSVGMGLGYVPREYQALGVPWEQRGRRFDEILGVLKLMWTQDRVTYQGKYYQLDDIAVQTRPIQEPHPPIWIGAHAKAGIERAAKFDAFWPITPQVPIASLSDTLTDIFDAREKFGLSRYVQQPLRREIMLGADRDDALAKAVKAATPWYVGMATTGSDRHKDTLAHLDELGSRLATHWIYGTGDECAAQLRAIGSQVPVNPVITRANWPGISTEDTVAFLDRLGEQHIPALKVFEPATTMT